jgi:hypothetical protein
MQWHDSIIECLLFLLLVRIFSSPEAVGEGANLLIDSAYQVRLYKKKKQQTVETIA